MSQVQDIYDHLCNYGSITPMEALSLYGCFRLAARIDDLKRMGAGMESEMVSSTNRDGRAVRFAQYRLRRKEAVQMELEAEKTSQKDVDAR